MGGLKDIYDIVINIPGVREKMEGYLLDFLGGMGIAGQQTAIMGY